MTSTHPNLGCKIFIWYCTRLNILKNVITTSFRSSSPFSPFTRLRNVLPDSLFTLCERSCLSVVRHFICLQQDHRKKKIKTITGHWSKRRLKTNSWITRWQSSLGPSSWEDGHSKLLFYWSCLTRISRGFKNKAHLIFVTQLIGQRQVQNSCFFFSHIRVKSFYRGNFVHLFLSLISENRKYCQQTFLPFLLVIKYSFNQTLNSIWRNPSVKQQFDTVRLWEIWLI